VADAVDIETAVDEHSDFEPAYRCCTYAGIKATRPIGNRSPTDTEEDAPMSKRTALEPRLLRQFEREILRAARVRVAPRVSRPRDFSGSRPLKRETIQASRQSLPLTGVCWLGMSRLY